MRASLFPRKSFEFNFQKKRKKGKNGKFNRVIVPLGQPTLLSKEIKKTHFDFLSWKNVLGFFCFLKFREPLQVLRTLTLFSLSSPLMVQWHYTHTSSPFIFWFLFVTKLKILFWHFLPLHHHQKFPNETEPLPYYILSRWKINRRVDDRYSRCDWIHSVNIIWLKCQKIERITVITDNQLWFIYIRARNLKQPI